MVCRKSVILEVYFSSFFSPGFAPYFRMSVLEHSPLNSESSSHLTIEPENSVRSDLDELSANEAEPNTSLKDLFPSLLRVVR